MGRRGAAAARRLYRVDPLDIAAMHVALDEVGHPPRERRLPRGWDEGYDVRTRGGEDLEIPRRRVSRRGRGARVRDRRLHRRRLHRPELVGMGWGSVGLAVLSYHDWRENAMDCWVAQMGVVTSVHLAIAQSGTLRRVRGRVEVAEDEKLRNHEIAPYVINMENSGRLSDSGDFRTQPGDVEALVTTYLERARAEWGLGKDDPADIAIYAHGGLTDEATAAATAGSWIPALYQQKVFPDLPHVGNGPS